MIKTLLAASAVIALASAAPAMAEVELHQNPSLNSYVGHATDAQYAQATAFDSSAELSRVEAVGSADPSLESFNPNAVIQQPTRFQTAPEIAENPDFNWIDQPDVGA